MVQPYSQDLRERVMSAVDDGTSVRAAAPVFPVSISYIYKASSRRRAPARACGLRLSGLRWQASCLGEDVSEVLDIHQAPMPSLPIACGRPGPGLLAHVLTAKVRSSQTAEL